MAPSSRSRRDFEVKIRTKQTLKKYGLTEQSFAALWEAQKGCVICAIPESDLE